jgi:hypothetical protein
MLRTDENPESPFAALYLTGTDLVFALRRVSRGEQKIIAKAPARLVSSIGLLREGNQVTARFQRGDAQWLQIETSSLNLGITLRAGFFSASGQIPAQFVTAKFTDYSLGSLNFSVIQSDTREKGVSIHALEDDPTVAGPLFLESSADLKFWKVEPATISGTNGEVLDAFLPLRNHSLQFYRIRKKD